MARYARRKHHEMVNDAGELRCDRCGRVVREWPLQRADNCGTSRFVCIRTFAHVIAGWQWEQARSRTIAQKGG